MSVLARRRAIMGSIVQPKRSCLGMSRCCHVLVTVHAGASQGYVLGIPVRVRVRVRVSTPMHVYCDQSSLLTRDPGGGVNKKNTPPVGETAAP